ncbi:GNAT family N-acetyltransferase [Staphylococcus taiwanensis]|nr:GNAT family N-acetyltransferase [Staphylococcus taiwanensis]
MIKYSNEAPQVQAYCDLRVKTGMSPKSEAAARNGLPNACYNITIYDDDKLIAMGRVIGDGGTAFQVVDVAVDPDYQGQGYGRMILEKIMAYVEEVAEQGTYVSLIADYPADKLYEKFGFQSTEPKSGGMYIVYK